MLKSRFIIICAYFIFPVFTSGQVSNSHNLVRNSGFENGSAPSNNFCNGVDDLNDVADYWQRADVPRSPSSCGAEGTDPKLIYRGNNNCVYQFADSKVNDPKAAPFDRIYGNCASQSVYDKFYQLNGDEFNVGDRVLKMQSTFMTCALCKYEANQSAVITDLRQNLEPGTDYILRIQAMPLRGDQEVCWSKFPCQQQCYNYGNNILQVYFSENGKADWYREPSNASYNNDLCKNPNSLVNAGRCGEWQYFTLEFNIDGDCENSEVGDVNDLRFLVLKVNDGAFLIDNVELYEKCPNESITIKSIDYDGHFYDSFNFINPQGSPYTTYSSDNVHTLSGSSVMVEDGAVVNYWSGSRVTLNPGFKAEKGSYFEARIRDCNPGSWISKNSGGGPYYSTSSKENSFNKNSNGNNVSIDKIKVINSSAIQYKRNYDKHYFYYKAKRVVNNGVSSTSLEKGIRKVLVYTSLGRKISQKNFPTPKERVKVSLNNAKKGVYLVKLYGKNANYTKKIVK